MAVFAVVGVLALFLAAPAVPWSQSETYAAERELDGSPTAEASCKFDPSGNNDITCAFTGADGTITLTNATQDDTNWAVYVTGGDDYDIQARSTAAPDGPALGQNGLAEHLVTILEQDGLDELAL